MRQDTTTEDVNTLELTVNDGHPLDAVAAALDALDVTEDRIQTAQIAVTYEPDHSVPPEPAVEDEPVQDEEETVELDINVVDTCSVSYGSQAHAILKHLEEITDENEWATPLGVAERLGDESKATTVSAQISKYHDRELVERAPRDDIPQTAYKYKITLLGREALRRCEFEEDQSIPA